MNTYTWNCNNMEYTGIISCQKDPVRSAKEKRDVWLLPADSTFTAPPEFDPETQKAVWDGEAWHIEAMPEPEPEPDPTPDPEPTADERISALEAENHLLNQQVEALTDQNDFQEELIVELANVVYA